MQSLKVGAIQNVAGHEQRKFKDPFALYKALPSACTDQLKETIWYTAYAGYVPTLCSIAFRIKALSHQNVAICIM